MPALFDFPFLPMAATGVSTGGDTAASQTVNLAGNATGNAPGNAMGSATGLTAATTAGDFASLLAALKVTPAGGAATPAQQNSLPPVAMPAPINPAGVPVAATGNVPALPAAATLLQMQAPVAEAVQVATPTPAVAAVAAPEGMTQTVQPQILDKILAPALAQVPAPAVPAEAALALPDAQPATPKPIQHAEAAAIEAPVAVVTQAEAAQAEAPQAEVAQIPVAQPAVVPSQTEPQAAIAQAPTPMADATPVQIEAPVVTTPSVKTAETKPAKTPPAKNEDADTATAEPAEKPAATPDMVSVAVVAPAMIAPTVPVASSAGQPVVAANDGKISDDKSSDKGATPAPKGQAAPVVPQSPAPQSSAPQNQADAADVDATDNQADVAAQPKFAALMTAAPHTAAPAAKAPAPAAMASSASAPGIAAARTETPAPEATNGAAPAQTPQTRSAPVQVASVQAAHIQAPQAQAAQVQSQVQAIPRKSASASVENNSEVASPPPAAAAPSGFSLVSNPQTTDATGYTPAATPQAPAASLMSQTAVDNLNALSVQINRRHAEGATKFTMELHPADLGKVDVALSIGRDGKMTAHMTFDSDVTAATFSAHEAELRQQLRDTGLQLSDDALSFSTRQKTDAMVQAQAHSVNASARSADDSASGGSSSGGSPQPQNTFTQADSQQGQNRPNSQHLAQMARTQAAADQADAELDALNGAVDLAAARLNYRQSPSRLALDLSV